MSCSGSGWLLTASPRPVFDPASRRYKCPWCGRLILPCMNLQIAAHCLARHNKKAKTMNHRSILIRGERVRLYRHRHYWFAHQADLTFLFYVDDAGWQLCTEPRNKLGQTERATGRTMQQAVDNSTLPEAT